MLGASSEDHVQVDPAQRLMREVGAQLRHRRLERGEDLDDVAKSLRIKPSYLFGIEQGDLSALPGRVYALGFLRSYADHLGFDGDDLVSRIKASGADPADQTRLRMRMPLAENRLPKAPVVVISLAVVVGLYAGWSYMYDSSRMATDPVAEVPRDLRDRVIEGSPVTAEQEAAPEDQVSDGAAGSEDPTEPTTADPTAASATARPPGGSLTPQAGPSGQAGGDLALNDDPGRLAVQPAAGADAAGPLAPGAQAARSGGAATGPTPAASDGAPDNPEGARTALQVLAALDPALGGPQGPQLYERAHADARVILRAREAAWIQVSSPAGDYAFTRTLQPGEAVLVPNRPDMELWTGNAGGLEIIVDGAPVAALAGGGAVRRHVSLDPERLIARAERQP
jgi:cytoskeleton protein RodZ